jgi:uncharacterized protein YegP (UPF0339 family)
MAGKFELSKGKTGKFSFNLKAGNGQIVFTSQTYDDKRSATAGIKSVRKNAQKAARFERKESAKKQPYFVITATNGQVVGKSQMYANPVSMEKGIKSVMNNAPEAPVIDLTADEKKPAGKKAPAGKAAGKAAAAKKATAAKAPAKKAAAKKAAAKKAPAGKAVAAKAAADKAPARKKAAAKKAAPRKAAKKAASAKSAPKAKARAKAKKDADA